MAVIRFVTTHDLRPGDVVLVHGMRVRLNGDATEYQGDNAEANPVRWWRGEILNVAEVLADGFIPAAWVRQGEWTIQGNGLAYWDIERS